MDKRTMFRGAEVHEFSDILLEKFKIHMEETPLFEIFHKYFTTDFKIEVLNAFEERFNKEEWENVRWYLKYQIHGKKKKNWRNKAFKDYEEKKAKKPTELYGFYTEITQLVEQQKRLKLENFKPVPVEEEVYIKMKQIDDWEKSDALLSTYPFFQDKTIKVARRAIIDDIALELIYFLGDEWDGVETCQATKHIRDYPFDRQLAFSDTQVRKELTLDGQKVINGELVGYKQLSDKADDFDLVVENSQELDELSIKLGISNSFKDLDYDDREIISSVLSQRAESFATDSTIRTSLRTILLDAFSSDNTRQKESLVRRLINITKMRFAKFDEETKGFSIYGIFDFIRFYGDDNSMVEIVINKAIYDTYINNQTLRIYRDQLNKLEKPMYSFLLFMQKERISAYKRDTTIAHISLQTFRDNIRFEYKQKKKVHKEISDALDTLIENNLLVNKYEKGADLFIIEFIALDIDEVNDIVNHGSRDGDSFTNLINKKEPLL